ncbi:MAG TPA: arylsulfatase [Lacipirellulaceae bacterium]|nr:arylsulfatase [Lacipirellulaceae bacterium]
MNWKPLAWVVMVAAALTGAAGAHAADAVRPNIVFILADDLGYGDLGCYGQRHFATPHLDQMAAEGLRFTQHYTGSTVCAPSRACLLAGQHTGHVYQRANGEIAFRPDPQDISIARLLKDAGYRTALIGKSGLSCRTPNGRHPNDKGFDHFFGFVSHGEAHRHYPRWLWRNGARVDYPDNGGFEGEPYATDLFLADALEFLDQQQRGAPFFLHLALTPPHADLAAPPRWREPLLGQYDEAPADSGNYRPESHPKATYAAMIACIDDVVGQVAARLRDRGLAKQTLVLFASDNGAMSEGGWSRTHFQSSGPLRGGKRDLYEGGLRTPLIAWQPGAVPAGGVTDHVSAFWDFVPTACELAGIDAPGDTDGKSYLPVLRGGSQHQVKHDYLYWEFYEQGGKQAVRQGPWKLVRLNALRPGRATVELYNLDDDLGETQNVADDHPEIVARLLAAAREAHRSEGQFVMPP